MADQVIEQYMYATGHEEPCPRPDGSTFQGVSPHNQYDERRGRKHNHGPQTPSESDIEAEKRSSRRSLRRRRRSADSYRGRSPERRRYFEEYRQRRRFEPDLYRQWNYGYLNDWRPRGRRFSWWRGTSRGYGGPRYGRGRSSWYGGFDRKPARFYPPRYSERYPTRRFECDNFEYARERAYRRREVYDEDRRSMERTHERVLRRREEYDEDRRSRESTHERVHRRREEYDEDRRSRRSHERERTRKEVRTSEDFRSHVTSSRTMPADEYTDTHRPETTYVNNNYTDICT